MLKAAPLSTEFRTAEIAAAPAIATAPAIAAPAIAIPTTRLLPVTYETKPLYRFAAPAPIVAGSYHLSV